MIPVPESMILVPEFYDSGAIIINNSGPVDRGDWKMVIPAVQPVGSQGLDNRMPKYSVVVNCTCADAAGG